jgi:hypothetical protein
MGTSSLSDNDVLGLAIIAHVTWDMAIVRTFNGNFYDPIVDSSQVRPVRKSL